MLELIVEPTCEPTQLVCSRDHATICASSFPSKTKYLGTPLLSKCFNFPKIGAKTYFKNKSLTKAEYLQSYRDMVL
jgi:hypothetical protein